MRKVKLFCFVSLVAVFGMFVMGAVDANAQENPLWGSWGPGYNPADGSILNVTFYPGGYYFHYQTDAEETCDNGGGVEYGAYNYNSSTQQMTMTPTVDENGCIGFADGGNPGTYTVYVDEANDQLVVVDDGENRINRVTGASPIVGSWGPGYYQPEDYWIHITFYPNGYYFHWEPDGDDDCDEGGGAEYGSYTYENGVLTPTPIVDENGCYGLNDVMSTTLENDNITFYENDGPELGLELVDTDGFTGDGITLYDDNCNITQAVLEERQKYDPDGDGVVGLEVAIYALQVVTGTVSDPADPGIPDQFSMEWLKGKTLYIAWYGEGTDSNGGKLFDVPVVEKIFFGTDGTATVKGLMNSSQDLSANYNVNPDGLLYFGEDSFEGNVIVCGSTSQYVKSHYVVNGNFDNVDLFFFNQTDAMNSAALWGAGIPKCLDK